MVLLFCTNTEAMHSFIERKCSELLELPGETYLCPITHELFVDPVVATDGHTYERGAIERYLQKSCRSPLTNQPLPSKQLVPNHFCRSAVAEYRTSVLQGIKDVLPAAQDMRTINELVRRGLECASCEAEHRDLRAQVESLLAGRAKAAEAAGLTDDVILALDALMLSCGEEATKQAVASLERIDLLWQMETDEHAAKGVVLREMLLRKIAGSMTQDPQVLQQVILRKIEGDCWPVVARAAERQSYIPPKQQQSFVAAGCLPPTVGPRLPAPGEETWAWMGM